MYLLRRVCLYGMGGRRAHSHCWRAWLGMERVGYYTGNHFSVVVAITGVDVVAVVEATWNGFGSRFHKWVHNVGRADLLKRVKAF